jgi:hypothetical protein
VQINKSALKVLLPLFDALPVTDFGAKKLSDGPGRDDRGNW